ncbi:DNA-binding MarR family transcriptional regulator [Methylopila capsulata]|uniref:Transcriptional regulator n=1 Tax=Methylopila capsulata TaxID=61654 RepID=A0A9W6IVJ4_9HYPH|nr:MarR family transcriptional regulator [Methylopila capsulata]MBM7850657.1 DNA-binding MarR family transcriptional regulator [Methylopila capsulata]GLK55950.1 transcriptional regulator [Methylopila capsulata]
MTDVTTEASGATQRPAAARAIGPEGAPAYDLIELLFFAYRDFVRDADEALAAYGFGRAHHRVLHFVDRNPGLRVTELLDILKITKQSLGRVLRELIDQGFVIQREGASDRRQRLLFVTERGDALALKLAHLQTERISRALDGCDADVGAAARRFLFAMVDPEERNAVARLATPGRPRGGRA